MEVQLDYLYLLWGLGIRHRVLSLFIQEVGTRAVYLGYSVQGRADKNANHNKWSPTKNLVTLAGKSRTLWTA